MVFLSDEGKTSLLSVYGKGELTVGSPVPLPNLSPNQEETQVRSDCGKATSDPAEKEEVKWHIVWVLQLFFITDRFPWFGFKGLIQKSGLQP